MARVSVIDGMRYGISMLGYILGVTIFGFLFFIVGIFFFYDQSPVIGVPLTIIGSTVLYAGLAGTGYKIIADAVAKGNENAATTPTAQKVPESESRETQSGSSPPTATKIEDPD